MSLQQIIDATPDVSWRESDFKTFLGSSHKYTYALFEVINGYAVFWMPPLVEEYERFIAPDPQSIINHINTLEGK